MRYGVPYRGSKNKIADWVVDHLPDGKTFVDLFAGGCAVTHAAILAGRWENFIINDLGDAPEVFENAVNGKYANEKRWINRETFQKLKDVDPYVRFCWSFGNNGRNYLYAKEVEPWKKALHYARVFGDTSLLRNMEIEGDGSCADVLAHKAEYKEKYIRWWLLRQKYPQEEFDKLIKNVKDDVERGEEELRAYLLKALKSSGLTQAEVQRRLGTQMAGHYFGRSQWGFSTQEMYQRMQEFMPLPDDYNELVGLYRLRQSLESLQSLQSLQSLESLQRLQSLERLQRLQSLERLQRLQSLERLQLDYRNVEIPKDAVVYADPPYKNTDCTGYAGQFDYDAFEKWLADVPFMVIVSEYNAPKGCAEIASIKKQQTMGTGNKGGTNIEKLFVQDRFYKRYKYVMDYQFEMEA